MWHYGYYIENEIFWKGLYEGWEKTSLQIWTKLAEDADVIFDVGANTGIFSLIAKAVNPASDVYAFEPVDRVFEKLEKNNTINNYNIKCEKLAASNFTGEATIYDSSAEHTYSVTVNKNLYVENKNIIERKIQVKRLDEYIEEKAIKNIDLIKIDVETHEPEVLEGLGVLLEKYQPSMLIEILNDDIATTVQELIKNIDYLYFNIDEINNPKQVQSLTKSDFHNFLLCNKEKAEYLGLLKK